MIYMVLVMNGIVIGKIECQASISNSFVFNAQSNAIPNTFVAKKDAFDKLEVGKRMEECGVVVEHGT